MAAHKLTYKELEQENESLRQILDNYKREEKFNSYFENNKAIMLQINPITKQIVNANNAAIEFYGYNREVLLKKSINDINTLSNKDIEKKMNKALERESNFFQFQHKLANGEDRDVDVYASPVKVANETLMISTIYDITDRNNAEKELLIAKEKTEKSEAQFKELSNLTFEGIIIHNKGIATDVNLSLSKMFGYTKEELLGKNLVKLLISEKDHEIIAYNIKNKRAIIYEVEGIKKDGTLFPIELEARSYYTKNNISNRVTAVRDLSERKKIESEIKKLKIAVEQSANTIVITDIEGNIEYTNPKFTEVTGYTAQEAIGQNPRILKSGKQSDEYYANMWKIISAGEVWHGEFNNKTKSGENFWEQVTITPLKDESGNIINYLAIKEDITKLKESEERLMTFINTVPDPICYKDGKGRWLLANNAELETFCLSNNDYFGKTDKELASFTNEIYREAFSNCMISDEIAWENKNTMQGIEIIPTIDGGEKVFDVFKIPVFHSNGDRKALVVIGRDITSLNNTQVELSIAKENAEYIAKKLNDAQEIAHLGNWELDILNNKLVWSDEIYRLFNLKPQEFEASYDAFLDNIHPEDRDMVNDAYLNSLENKLPYEIEHRLLLKNNEIKYVLGKCKTEFDKSGNPLISVGIVQDITLQKDIEAQLLASLEKSKESDRLKTEFINNMSHEIRTPMNGILGFSEFLSNHELTKEKQKHYINLIQSSGNQLMRIIDDILEISELGTKQVKAIEKQICLNDLLLELFSIFDIRAKESEIPLYLKKGLSDYESLIFTDESKVNKILSNLLENALKFTYEGFIEFGYNLKTNIEPNVLEIYVKDTGIGIKPESQKSIFNRFSQEEKKLSRSFGGLGLGLSIAKENAKLLGGNISLESKKGKGSTFFITIPYKAVKPKTEKISNYTILIAEDEEVNYLYLETILESFDPNIIILHAKHGKEAIEICKQNREIDLVLMDLKMPIMTGFKATKLIKEVRPNLPIIAQTAYSTREEIEIANLAGCDDFISKPINQESLKVILKKYLKV